MHFGVAFLFLILGGGGCGDERGVHQGSLAQQQQAAGGQVGVDGGEEATAQVVGFEQATEFQERGGIGHAVGGESNGAKPRKAWLS